MKRLAIIALLIAALVASGCSVMTSSQKQWIQDKANRSAAYVKSMDAGQTTPEQDKLWIHSQDESWQLWSQKAKNGVAAPSFVAGE